MNCGEEKSTSGELEEMIHASMPEVDTLEKALDELCRDIELSKDEQNRVMRNLERIWHMIRFIRLLSEYFRDAISFGGGAVINYLYMPMHGKKPRFTFDIDSSWKHPASAKRDILEHLPRFNKWLSDNNYVLRIPVVAHGYVWLGVVEYDVEKDYFPDILSLRIPILTRYTGTPFYNFLGLKGYGVISSLRKVFQRELGMRDPLIDYVRLEISLGMQIAPVVNLETRDLFGNNLKIIVTEPELQLAWKVLGKAGKTHENPDTALHDILKAVLDLRLLSCFDRVRIREHVKKTELPEIVFANAERNLHLVKTRGRKHWNGHHYELVRRTTTLDEVVDEVKNMLRNTLWD